MYPYKSALVSLFFWKDEIRKTLKMRSRENRNEGSKNEKQNMKKICSFVYSFVVDSERKNKRRKKN